MVCCGCVAVAFIFSIYLNSVLKSSVTLTQGRCICFWQSGKKLLSLQSLIKYIALNKHVHVIHVPVVNDVFITKDKMTYGTIVLLCMGF